MKTKKRSSASSNILRYIWGSALATIFLTTILSFWLLSGSWGTWKSAHNNVIQFDIFYRVLQVSNDLAGERAFVNELILSSPEDKESRWQALVTHREITDRDMQKIPKNLLSPALMSEMLQQLDRSRRVADSFRTQLLSDPKSADLAIHDMVVATDFYHKALFERTTEFLLLEPSALGPILRAQALGELRDATGRLGSQVLIPLATHTPIPRANRERLIRGIERINTAWWLLQTQGNEVTYLPHFQRTLENTRRNFEHQGIALINQLNAESDSGKPYSVSAEQFAVDYHASLSSFDDLLNTYMNGVKAHYTAAEHRALKSFLLRLVVLGLVYTLTIAMIFYIRSRVLRPILRLNELAAALIAGKQLHVQIDDDTAEEVQSLFSSLGTLGKKLREDARISRQYQRQSEEDPLTHLFNRRAFNTRAEALLSQSSKALPAWLVMLDVDRFKSINDNWGHPMGDEVLVALAKTLSKLSRPEDVVGRLGGEEFAVLFLAASSDEVASYTARIQQEIRKLTFHTTGDITFKITASFGVSQGWQCPLQELMSRADRELYNAKNSGRDRICGLS
ncbi:TPA: GGDEF domain-containing protein [Raoultella planticola]|uniref:GGDEF domain-containing protein n=1 Tax=Raoultella planticola TaxID=575 RepID=UPI001A2B0F50|nr:GGDEF domain-containing protein [Raoultella planticola]HAT1622836.1 GGDEF domain-containing protein [Raoultella planticola]